MTLSNKVLPLDLYEYLLEKGMTKVQALGVLANVQGESDFDAAAHEIGTVFGKGGYGLFQHTGPRRGALRRYCEKMGWMVWDWKAQVDFAMTEDETKRYMRHSFKNAEAATEWWVLNWERPANPVKQVEKRLKFLPALKEMVEYAGR